jgi:hypothetical protein
MLAPQWVARLLAFLLMYHGVLVSCQLPQDYTVFVGPNNQREHWMYVISLSLTLRHSDPLPKYLC